jgi:DNA-binding response OmpR family regulator
MKILLVDDEKKFALMLSKRLVLRGIEVDYVFSGEEAVAKAEKNEYDVAILDVKMPGIGGIELQRKLKGLAPGMKIIFLTGHGSKTDFEIGSTEADHYLAKPLQFEELIKILHETAT